MPALKFVQEEESFNPLLTEVHVQMKQARAALRSVLQGQFGEALARAREGGSGRCGEGAEGVTGKRREPGGAAETRAAWEAEEVRRWPAKVGRSSGRWCGGGRVGPGGVDLGRWGGRREATGPEDSGRGGEAVQRAAEAVRRAARAVRMGTMREATGGEEAIGDGAA